MPRNVEIKNISKEELYKMLSQWTDNTYQTLAF